MKLVELPEKIPESTASQTDAHTANLDLNKTQVQIQSLR